MENFKPNESDITARIKHSVKIFLLTSKHVDSDLRAKLIHELDNEVNYDLIGTDKNIIEDAISYAVNKWESNNLELADLWKKIAINNAKIGQDPYVTANETVSSFKKQFTLNKDK